MMCEKCGWDAPSLARDGLCMRCEATGAGMRDLGAGRWPREYECDPPTPRDPRDVASDPDGLLIVRPGEPLRPAQSTKDTNPKDSIGDRKVPLWLLSPIAKAHWAVAQFSGLIKYGAWNWRKAGVRKSIYLSAMQRHMDAYLSGEEHDPVDGTKHLGNIMACAAILLDAEAAGKIVDDRPPSVGLREAYAEVEATMSRLREQYADKAPRHYTIEDTEH